MIQELIKKAYLAGYAKGEKCDFIKPKGAKEHMANDYAEELVKNLTLPVVVLQSEQLLCEDCGGKIDELDAWCKHCGEVIG